MWKLSSSTGELLTSTFFIRTNQFNLLKLDTFSFWLKLSYFTLEMLCSSSFIFCICRAEPDLEFEGLLKRQHTRVKYFQGSLMNAMDLERAKVQAPNDL